MDQNTAPCNNTVKNKTEKITWTSEEEIVLCKSWIAVSTDASVGRDQTTTFWSRIRDHYLLDPKANPKRSAHSLEQHWSDIQARTNEFCRSIAKAQAHDGENTDDDIHDRAAIIHANDYYKPFKYPHCWCILRKSEKWKEYNRLSQNKKQARKNKQMAKLVEVDDVEEEDEELDSSSSVGGRDAARNMKKRKAERAIESAEDRYVKHMSIYDEYDQNMLAEMKRSNEIATEQASIARRDQDIKIMSMDLSILDEASRAFFQELKDEILKRSRQ